MTRKKAIDNYAYYLDYINPRYDRQWFHTIAAEKQQELIEGNTFKKIMFTMPPQHGKTESSTRNLPGWVLGKYPDTKIAILTYSKSIASGFNRDIKRRMETPAYHSLFPNTLLGSKREGYINTNEQAEVVGHSGFIYTIGLNGGLTSKTVDLGIVDDPIKDRKEAYSPTYRENVWNWYVNVLETRLHNESRQMLMLTRWHEDDLAGRLLKRDGVYHAELNPNGWYVISFPALRTNEINDYDPRQIDEPLWPEKHSFERIDAVRKSNSVTFNALYQQDPKPSDEALVFPRWIQIDQWPEHLLNDYGLAGDFGFTNNPTALVKVAREGNKLYLDEQIYGTGLTNQQILVKYHTLKLPRNIESFWDKAEPKSIAELVAGTAVEVSPDQFVKYPGINAKGADKGAIVEGINKLNEYTVYYTKRSQNIHFEKNHYQYEMDGGKPTNRPIKKHDHIMDGVRTYVWTRWGQPEPSGHKTTAIPMKQPMSL